MPDGSVVNAPALTGDEVLALVREAGGADGWAGPVYLASRSGHPQLAHALVTGLRARGWPEAERDGFALFGAAEVAEEAELARRKLVAAVPDQGARTLLHRLSMVADRFPRSVALAVADVPPPSRIPGEHFDALVGPWVDQVGPDRFRVSPLITGAGQLALAAKEQAAVHRAVVKAVINSRSLDADQANNAFLHGIQGGATHELRTLSKVVFRARKAEVRALRPHLLTLAIARTDRVLYTKDLRTSLMLRLAQFELVASRGASEATAACARALVREARDVADLPGSMLQLMALVKIATKDGLSNFLPEWPDFMAQFLALLPNAPPEMATEITTLLPSGHGPAPMLFAGGVAGLRSVAGLASAFERLHALDPAIRDSMLSPMEGFVFPATLATTCLDGPFDARGF